MSSDFLSSWEENCLKIESIEFPVNFQTLLSRAADLYGSRKALHFIDTDWTISFAELNEHVLQLASGLSAAGVSKGTRVGVLLPNRPEFPLTWLALAHIGAVMVPTNIAYTSSELDYLYNDSGISYLLIDHSLLPAFLGMQRRPAALVDANVIVVGSDQVEPFRSFQELATSEEGVFHSSEAVSGDDLLNIQYTSGTTGFPKGCMQHQRYWMVLGCTVGMFTPEIQSILTDHPYFYMDPQWQLVWGLYSGATVYVSPKMSISKFWERVRRHGIQWAWFPLPVLNLPETRRDRDHPIKYFHAGAISSTNVKIAEQRFGVPVRSAYGMTEIGAGTVIPHIVENDEILETVGLRSPFRELKIVDEDGKEVSAGTPGELIVRGDGIFLGYWNNPTANERCFYREWFRTGDMFVQTRHGYYKIVGRLKDMIRRSGENISAMEVEYVVQEITEIAEVAAVPVPDEYRGEEVKIYVKLNDGFSQQDCPPQKIIAHCTQNLAPFKVPRYIAYIDTFPYTPSGKIAKHDLSAGVPDLRADSYDHKNKGSSDSF